ncbi:hypothetical protein BC777_0361 [Yoonia maricola]|uniref:Uncharacterized protein n=1 Tax=Yoonia maricola TaxID=420999 RepID=A0A2M8WKS1_9RHOB|nr:hypothetical protein [Yoonia maricola]PJI91532.1 hypothetical protein BC777_0361 [Yoonia maricola]
MTAKPHIDGTARARAGVPLARAQRLAEKADAKSRSDKSFLPLISAILGLAVLGTAGYFYSGSGVSPAVDAAKVSVVSSADTADQSAVLNASPLEETVERTVAAVPEKPEAVVANVDPTAPLAPRPALAPCVQSVEQQLFSLHNANDQGAVWDVKRQHIRDAVQSVLDCDVASFDLTGDFELAASDLADLQINWDRSAANLKLTVVDSVAPAAQDVAYTDDGQPIAFIVN